MSKDSCKVCSPRLRQKPKEMDGMPWLMGMLASVLPAMQVVGRLWR